MTRKSVPASVRERAFDCPHCGAFTTQTWYHTHAERIEKDPGKPFISDEESAKRLAADKELAPEMKERFKVWLAKLASGDVALERNKEGRYIYFDVHNLSLSQCYNCDKIAVWVYDRLLYPPERHGAIPNPDLPQEVLHDYEEARAILDISPRGAAALLRLCIQKLCSELGEKGKNIDDDIASLVAKGLNPLVQKSLDVVRVVGNEAVHPGVMDLKDDRETAATLFGLVNAIADQMITHPKTVDAMYKKLPETKRAAIAARDAKTDMKLK